MWRYLVCLVLLAAVASMRRAPTATIRKVPHAEIFLSAKHQAAHGEYALAVYCFRRYRKALLLEEGSGEPRLLVAFRELIEEIGFHADGFILPDVQTVRREQLPNCDAMGLARERVLEQGWYKQYQDSQVLMSNLAFGTISMTDATLAQLQDMLEWKRPRPW